jgi:hypothetical protein
MGKPSSTVGEADGSKSSHQVRQSLEIVWEVDAERGADEALLRAFEMIFPGEISMNAEFDKIDGQVHE